MDTKNVLDQWLNGTWEDNINKGKNSSGTSLGTRITDKNEGYIQELQSDIEDANKETINDITVDKGYKDTTQEILNTILEGRKKELTEDVETIKEIGDELEVAKTQADIDKAIPSRGQLRKDLGKEAAQELIDKGEEKADELLSLSQEAFLDVGKEIEEAESNADLDDISGRLGEIENLLADDRSELMGLIRDKRL